MSEPRREKGELDDQVEDLVRSAYVRMLVPSRREGSYVAEVLELPGCLTEGDTPEEAYQNLDEAMRGYFKTLLTHKLPVPEPVGEKEYSGHFPLRMSSELHRAAALRAMQEGVSLNSWIGNVVASRVAGEDLMDQLARRLQRTTAISFVAQMQLSRRAAIRGVAASMGPQTVRLEDTSTYLIDSSSLSLLPTGMDIYGKGAVHA